MAIATAGVHGADTTRKCSMTETTTTERETWRSWLAGETPDPDEGELLTRDEVLAHVARLGAPVTDSEFRYWTSLGILPGPVRRWFRGATRATYPKWMVLIVYAAHELHRLDMPLAEVGRQLRDVMFRDGPEKFLENFIKVGLFGAVGAAARHLRLLTGVTANHVEVTFSRDGDPDTAVTIEANLLL